MKEKATQKSSKTAFKKILNYLLFQNFNTPDFSTGLVNLSESFIESNKNGTSKDESLNLKLNDCFSNILIELNIDDRTEIIHSILSDQKSFDGLLFFFSMEVERLFKNKPSDIQEEFVIMLFTYKYENKLNVFIIIYFKLYFLELYNFKFSKTHQISKQEYQIILKTFTTNKSIV
jgi:hypothetical protein